MSEGLDEFDSIPDDFADIQGVDWAHILAGPSGSNLPSIEEHAGLPGSEEDIPSIPARPASSHSSIYFEDDYDNLDPSLLAELDRIEGEHALNTAAHPQKKRKDVAIDSQSGEKVPSVFLKKQRLDDASCLTSPQGKGKTKADGDVLEQILSAYEDEVTCPICCDFYAFAHISNPCGHSFCGSCGQQWYMKNKTCPVCRTHLEKALSMIPNITIDNIVEKHIQALALSGDQDWEPGGSKAEEWHKRKQSWRKGAVEQEKIEPVAPHRTRTYIPSVIDLTGAIHALNQPQNWFPAVDDLETDPTYEDTSDNELIPRPIRRARRQRRAAGPNLGYPVGLGLRS